MCCSGAEIGLNDDAEGILILDDLILPDGPGHSDGPELGMALAPALGLGPDVLWDLEVNANRPDAMSVMGVARDLAAGLGVGFTAPGLSPATSAASAGLAAETISVDIVDPTLCGRFHARLLRDVSVGRSPAWLTRRLTALGMRPVNGIVDISNYVMLELGQPSHTFDLDSVPDGHLRVRRAADGERVVTLDGVERTLAGGDGVIANRGDEVIGIAGIMGGRSTEISESTRDVLMEMAWWDPPSISRTAKRLNLTSEAATRFRRGTDWGHNIDRAADRFCQLATELSMTVAAGAVDERGNLPDRTPLRVRTARINGLLGTALSADAISGHLRSIGFGVAAAGDDLAVTVPTWRWDTSTETDVAEEVARLHGYENIVPTVPTGAGTGALSPYQQGRRLVREVLVGAGCDETQPMPFLAPGDLAAVGLAENAITLTNPLDAAESVLRTSLLPGQLRAVAYNQRRFNPDVSFFEIGHVYRPPPDGRLLPDERELLAVTLAGEEAPQAVAVLWVLAEALALPGVDLAAEPRPGLHPTRSARVVVAGQARGDVGEVDPAVLETYGISGPVAWLQLDLTAVLDGPHGHRTYTPVSRYPPSDIDLAFVVPDGVAAASVERSIRSAGGELLMSVELFDAYRGSGLPEGARSLAYRLRFQALDRTLTDAEVARLRQACIDRVAARHDATLRG